MPSFKNTEFSFFFSFYFIEFCREYGIKPLFCNTECPHLDNLLNRIIAHNHFHTIAIFRLCSLILTPKIRHGTLFLENFDFLSKYELVIQNL